MQYKAKLLQSLSQDFSRTNDTVQMLNDEVQESLDAQLKGIEDKAKIKDFSEQYLKLRTPEMVDPTGASKLIEVLQDEILDFENEVDYVLSTSNATTTIDI